MSADLHLIANLMVLLCLEGGAIIILLIWMLGRRR